jgi:hypothetical protein
MFVWLQKAPIIFVISISTAPTEQISVEFDIGDFIKICQETPNLVKIRQKY